MARRDMTDEEIIEYLGSEEEDNLEWDEDSDEDLDSDDDTADPNFVPPTEREEEDIDNEIEENIRIIESPQPQPMQKRSRRNNTGSDAESTSASSVIKFSPDISVIKGKNGFSWKTAMEVGTRVPRRNIVHVQAGPVGDAKNCTTPLECFSAFITEPMLELILENTNKEIQSQRENYKTQNATVRNTSMDELRALLGVLILSAAQKNNHLTTAMLFNPEYSGNKYISTFSKDRFNFLINCLRFDEKSTREERKLITKLAPISELWEMLVANCRANYKPGLYLTIDEQLVGFRGKCSFRMYIPSKPDKYGLKLVMMCDNATKYMVDAIPYLGKGTVPKNVPAGEYFVKQLCKPIIKTNRNITMDNWFSSVPLCQSLLKDEGLTMIGTIKKNKREFVDEFVDIKFQERPLKSSLFLYHEDFLALSYKAKKNKIVLLISSAHLEGVIDEGNSLPMVISDYNKTKGAVDTFDQMCHGMNVGRKTKRWPLCYFYNMLNIASINSYVIYCHNAYRENKKPLSRLEYMLSLEKELTFPWQSQRLSITTLPSNLKLMLEKTLGLEKSSEQNKSQETPSESSKSRKYCGFCSYTKRRYTTSQCTRCKTHICGEHMLKICHSCINEK